MADETKEIGVSGLQMRNGMVFDEFLPELKGHRAIKKYKEMSDNESTIGAILHAMDMLIRAIEWTTEPADDSQEADEEADFVESVFEDMSHTFEEFVSEVLSFLVFGWSFFEVVYKHREGEDQADGSKRSRFNDGRIGIRKLAPRSQESLQKWEIDEDGGIAGMHQRTPQGAEVFIPIEKGLLFRTVNANNNPQGKSVLRKAYRAYWFLTNVQQYEAIAIERELNGLPVMKVPAEVLTASGGKNAQIRDKYEQIARDVKFNEQGFAMLPSDTFPDADGNPSNIPLVDFKLMASEGTRDIDTSKVIIRYQAEIARTVLADFIMLGQSERGSFAMSKSKSDLFLRSLEGYVNNIASVINRHLLPRLWKLNGLNPDLMPTVRPGQVAPQDLDELGSYIKSLAASGIPLGGDESVENALLEAAGLPTDQREDPNILGRAEET